MSRLALAEDVALAFDPTMLGGEIGNNSFFGTSDDADAVDSLAQNAESEFRERVDDPFRVQHMDRKETKVAHADGHGVYHGRYAGVRTDYTPRPVEFRLDHTPVLPIDSAEGDLVEVRTSANSYTDVTANDNDEYELLSSTGGTLLVYFSHVNANDDQGVHIPRETDRKTIKVKYRFGAPGGDHRLAGQTTLSGSGQQIDSTATPDSQSVADASKLPPGPFIALILDESDPRGTAEYVRIQSTDTDNDTINIAQRGERLSSGSTHDANEVVHYAPLFVRDAVAKRAAIALTQSDSYSEWLPDTNIPLESPRKIDEWRSDWQDAIDLLT